MPELPEVETIRIQLSHVLPGKIVKDVEVRSRGILQGDPRQLVGCKIGGLRRFGKMLVIDFTGGVSLAVHLKMTGRLVYAKFKVKSEKLKINWDIDYPTDKHTHIVITFTSGDRLYYHDQRKFGWLTVVPTDRVGQIPYVVKLGPEFLNKLTIQQFNSTLKRSNRPIKLVLMDQENFAGVGNIYANEGLWCAQIHPAARANSLSEEQAKVLFTCLEKILQQAIKWKGASEDNYRDAFGEEGEVQEHFQVYDRQGEPCPRCRQLIRKVTLGGRGTYYCPACQKPHLAGG